MVKGLGKKLMYEKCNFINIPLYMKRMGERKWMDTTTSLRDKRNTKSSNNDPIQRLTSNMFYQNQEKI